MIEVLHMTMSSSSSSSFSQSHGHSGGGLGYHEYFSSLPCSNCKQKSEPIIDFNTGDVICQRCGLVRSDHVIDTRSEVIIYAEDREKGGKSLRASTFDTLNTYGADDIIFERPMVTSSSGSGSGRISEDDLAMLKRAQQRVSGRRHSLIYQQLIELHACCSKLMLSHDIQNTAEKMVIQILQDNLIREADTVGLGKRVMIAACIYLACRQHRVPRILDEISQTLGIDVQSLSRTESMIIKRLQLPSTLIPLIDAKSIVNRMVCLLNAWSNKTGFDPLSGSNSINHSYQYTQQCLSICEEISNLSLLESVPAQYIVAAVIVWVIWLNASTLTLESSITTDRLCLVCHVTLSQVKNVIFKLAPTIDLIIPQSLERKLEQTYGTSNGSDTNTSTWKKRCLSFLTSASVLDKILVEGKEIGIPATFKTSSVQGEKQVLVSPSSAVETMNNAQVNNNSLSPSTSATSPLSVVNRSTSNVSISSLGSSTSVSSSNGAIGRSSSGVVSSGMLGKRFVPPTAKETDNYLAQRRKVMLQSRNATTKQFQREPPTATQDINVSESNVSEVSLVTPTPM